MPPPVVRRNRPARQCSRSTARERHSARRRRPLQVGACRRAASGRAIVLPPHRDRSDRAREPGDRSSPERGGYFRDLATVSHVVTRCRCLAEHSRRNREQEALPVADRQRRTSSMDGCSQSPILMISCGEEACLPASQASHTPFRRSSPRHIRWDPEARRGADGLRSSRAREKAPR